MAKKAERDSEPRPHVRNESQALPQVTPLAQNDGAVMRAHAQQ